VAMRQVEEKKVMTRKEVHAEEIEPVSHFIDEWEIFPSLLILMRDRIPRFVLSF
jgi:hypothetical protein